QRLRLADQQQLGLGVAVEKLPARRQGDRGAVVTPHAIDGQNDHASPATAPPPSRDGTARTMNRAGSPGRANAEGPRLRVVAPGQGVIGGWKTATVARTPRARAIDQA